jgi:hypothetical protein
MRITSVRAAVAAPVLLLALVGCGGSSDATPASQVTGTPAANGQRGGGFGGVDMTAIQACLTAAGISVPTPSGMPSGRPRPSGTFNGTPPADGVRPSRAAGGGGMFQSADVQAALKACGITLPTGQGSRPSATPTS